MGIKCMREADTLADNSVPPALTRLVKRRCTKPNALGRVGVSTVEKVTRSSTASTCAMGATRSAG